MSKKDWIQDPRRYQSFLYKMVQINAFISLPRLWAPKCRSKQYRYLLKKKSSCIWTSAFQTRVVQGQLCTFGMPAFGGSTLLLESASMWVLNFVPFAPQAFRIAVQIQQFYSYISYCFVRYLLFFHEILLNVHFIHWYNLIQEFWFK